MEHLRLDMKLASLENLPDYPLPEGYYIRTFEPGDQKLWAEVETAAGDFASEEVALKEYDRIFECRIEELKKRQILLFTEDNIAIGTSTAWWTDKYEPGNHGLIHWVAIKPDWQAKGLGRPLMLAVLNTLRNFHTDAYLCTHTHRHRAVRVYLDLGFLPLIRNDEEAKAWSVAAQQVRHPALEGL